MMHINNSSVQWARVGRSLIPDWPELAGKTKTKIRPSEIAQWIKASAAKLDNLSSEFSLWH